MTIKRAPEQIMDNDEAYHRVVSKLERGELITGEELAILPDVGPCELIDGRIVEMSPTGGEHGLIEMELARLIGNWIHGKKIGYVLGGEVGIYIRRKPDRIRAADVAFWTHEQLPDGPPVSYVEAAPHLVIEIVSTSNSWQEMRTKISDYFSIGTERVWVVEPANQAVLVYTSPTDHTVHTPGDTVHGDGPLDGLTVTVSELFGMGERD